MDGFSTDGLSESWQVVIDGWTDGEMCVEHDEQNKQNESRCMCSQQTTKKVGLQWFSGPRGPAYDDIRYDWSVCDNGLNVVKRASGSQVIRFVSGQSTLQGHSRQTEGLR